MLGYSFTATAHAKLGSYPVYPFQVRYEVYSSGYSIGEAVMALTEVRKNSYKISFKVSTKGLASLLGFSQVDEQVSCEIHGGTVRPIRYERLVKTPQENKSLELYFDWPTNKIRIRDNQRQSLLPLTIGVMDPLSLNLQLMLDLQKGSICPESEYRLVEKDQLKTYQIRKDGEDILASPIGRLRAVRIRRIQSDPGKARITTFWFSQDLHYLPVRVQQEKDFKELMRMEIRKVEL